MGIYFHEVNPIWKEATSPSIITRDVLRRSLVISWVGNEWVDNLKLTGERRSERRDFYEDMTASLLPTPIIRELNIPDRHDGDAVVPAGSSIGSDVRD